MKATASHDEVVRVCVPRNEAKAEQETESAPPEEQPMSPTTQRLSLREIRRRRRNAASRAYRQREKQKALDLRHRHAQLSHQVAESTRVIHCFETWESRYKNTMIDAYSTNKILLDALLGLLLERTALSQSDACGVTAESAAGITQIISAVTQLLENNNPTNDTPLTNEIINHAAGMDSEFMSMLEILAQESSSEGSGASSPENNSADSKPISLTLPSISMLATYTSMHATPACTDKLLDASLAQLKKMNHSLGLYISMLQKANAHNKGALREN